MNPTLLKAIVALALTGLLFGASTVVFRKKKNLWSFLQLFGAGCLVIVALTHICEALRVFPFMNWGAERSPGHYLDLSSAVLGLTLFPLGYLLDTLARRAHRPR